MMRALLSVGASGASAAPVTAATGAVAIALPFAGAWLGAKVGRNYGWVGLLAGLVGAVALMARRTSELV